MKLPKTLSTFTLLSSAIAGIVGSGWLLGPMVAARIAGPAAIVTWVLAGFMMMVIAATFVRLSRAIPTTGGTVRFFQMSYGHFAGFSFSWVAWLAWISVAPIEVMAMLQYSSHYIPHIMTAGVSPVLTHQGIIIAMMVMILMSVINNYGVKVYSRMNVVILVFKICVPVITVVFLISSHFHMHNMVSQGGFMPYGIKSIFAALPMAGIIYSFIGFNPAIQMAAETKNPAKSVPVAIFGSLAVCMVLYTLVQVAFIAAVPSASIAHGWKYLRFAGDAAPFIGLLSIVGIIIFAKVLYVDAAISPFGTGLVQAMATSRLTLAMVDNGYLPQVMGKVSAKGSPTHAIILNTVIGFMFFMPFPSWQHMVGFLSSALVLGYVVGPMSLMIISDTQPMVFTDMPKWQVHGMCMVALYVCSLMIYWSGWSVVAKIAVMFVLGYVVLAVMIAINSASRVKIAELNIARGSWVIIYMIGMLLMSYLSSFGGDNVIAFGYDFITMAIFTVVVYVYACICVYSTDGISSNVRQSSLQFTMRSN